MTNFRHSAWVSTVGYYVGLTALVHLGLKGEAFWWFYALGLYLLGSLTITAGYHRLFCHGSYKAHTFWHVLFGVFGILFLYSSPMQWSVTHVPHHKHSDTDLDPHPLASTALLWKGYRNVPLDKMVVRRLLRQKKWHKLLDSKYMAIWFALVVPVAVAAPDVIIYAYLPALGLAHFVGALHNIFSHWGKTPRDLWWMEYILPASGEWLHKTHHEQPRLWNLGSKWYHLDLGSWLIRAIRQAD